MKPQEPGPLPSRATSSEPVVSVRSPEHLGIALQRFRKRRSWTQKQVGGRAGVKQGGVSSVESGAPGTRLETLFKLLAALDLELVVRRRGGDQASAGQEH